jgi:uncharacterized protein (DUF2267 family)
MTIGVEALDHGIQELNQWINEIAERLGTPERRLAHCALRSVLHALRDRVGPDHAAHLAARLPLLVRSIFYDGYTLDAVPRRERSRSAFLEQVHIEGVQPLDLVELERAVKVVLAVLQERSGRAQIDNLVEQFPKEFADLFPPKPARRGPKRVGLKADPRKADPRRVSLKADPQTGIESIDESLQEALKWINAVEFRMNTSSSRLAMSSLQATLQGIREQLSAEQAVRFAAPLPMPLKGAYFEGWQPTSPGIVATRKEFLDRILATALRDEEVAIERAVKAAIEVIARKMPAAEMTEAAAALPQDLATLWPDEPAPYVDLNSALRQPPGRSTRGNRRPEGRPTMSDRISESSGSARRAPHRSRS